MKYEVLQDCVLVIKKGSVVIVDERQYETARAILKPLNEKANAKGDEEVKPQKETRKVKK